MDTIKVLEMIMKAAISFEGYKPLRFRREKFDLAKDTGLVSLFQQKADRWGLSIMNKMYCKESITFYTDFGLSGQDVIRAFSEAFGITVHSEEVFKERHKEFIARYCSR